VTITVINAGVSDPSSTRLLADRIAQKVIDTLRESGTTTTVRSIDLGALAVDIAQGLVSAMPNAKVREAIEQGRARGCDHRRHPVYKAGISGLFKSFADLIDDDLLIAKPVILAATGGSARHAMVVDDQLRPLFAFLRAVPMPTSLYAAPEDWGSTDLGKRIARAAGNSPSSCVAARAATSPTATGPDTSTSSAASPPAPNGPSPTSTSAPT
jgi:FMN reductase